MQLGTCELDQLENQLESKYNFTTI